MLYSLSLTMDPLLRTNLQPILVQQPEAWETLLKNAFVGDVMACSAIAEAMAESGAANVSRESLNHNGSLHQSNRIIIFFATL